MNAGKPWLIATLPGRSALDCRAEAVEAVRYGADIAEIRFDRWLPGEREALGGLFPAPLPLIGTYRSEQEGGEGSNDPAERNAALADLARFPFWGLDYERRRDPLPEAARRQGSIVSSHLPQGTPWQGVGTELLDGRYASRFVKVVVPASVSEALVLLDRALPDREGGRFLLHTTGPSGALFRALAWTLGFAAVYSSLPESVGRAPVEPRQIPVDRLRHFLSGPDPGPIFALLGEKVRRSRSPELFSTWMQALGDPGLYIGLEVANESELAEAVSTLPGFGVRGFNVTQPWKVPALNLASEAGPGAIPCRCANVLSVQPGEGLKAENTDLAALLRRLSEFRSEGRWDGRELLVVGTGGAARAALAAGRVLNADVRLLGRNPAAVEALAREFDARVESVPTPERAASLLIHATSLGSEKSMIRGVDPIPSIGPGTQVLDFVYEPEDRWLEAAAVSRGAHYEDGFRLLVYQAAESYAIWFGHPVPARLVAVALSRTP